MSPRREPAEPVEPDPARPVGADERPDAGAPGGPAAAWPGVEDPRVREGVAHLQHAARELIAASRALLDVAEELVDDPAAARNLASLVGTLAQAAGKAVAGGLADVVTPGAAGGGASPGAGARRPDDDPPVQRIPIS